MDETMFNLCTMASQFTGAFPVDCNSVYIKRLKFYPRLPLSCEFRKGLVVVKLTGVLLPQPSDNFPP